ncbi:MAG: hypothetical protein U9O54_07715 [Chloroflexota bacterium]|nr:hypothetical protein [Chloroflexota bacterium]
MTEKRCPLCGKLNPEDREVCQFCEARLTPLGNLPAEEPDTSSLIPGATPTPQDTSELEQTLPAWLQNARKEPDEDGDKAEDDDWLQRIQDLESEEKATGGKHLSKKGGELPDWLSGLDDEYSQIEEETEKEEELPDWLLKLGEEPNTLEETSDELFATDDVPDWVKEGIEKPIDEEAPGWFAEPETEQPETEDEFAAEEASSLFEDTPEEETIEEAKIPDWFSEIEAEQPETKDAFATEEASSLFEDTPEEETIEEAKIPDWFSEIETKQPETKDAFASEELSGLFEDTPEETIEEEMPDWLLAKTHPEEAIQFSSEETEDAPVQPFQLDGEEDIFEDELPEWLTAASAAEVMEEEQLSKTPDELSSSELPGWIEAMRPVVTTPDQDTEPHAFEEEYVENSGPLAGIINILPAETEISKFQKATKHSFKLKVTPAQQKYTSILEELISEEGASKIIPEPIFISTQRVLWWIIALVLLLFVGATIQYGSGQFPYPLHLEENIALNQSIQSLPENAPVLVAFEYEPALSGEMNAVAAGVIDHLMLNNAYLTFISTSPTGHILAENFLDTVQAEHQYNHGQQYVNFGYLPGGAAGLLSFVIAPQEIMPLAFDGTDAWAARPLQGIDFISDFSLVLVITDDPDTARLWIEQVQPHLGGTPLGIVASAQAAPLIRPYYKVTPKQVSGIVAGIPEGAAYEQLNARGNLSQAYWDAFNIGVSATLVVLLIGGIVNLISGSFHKNKASKNEEHA